MRRALISLTVVLAIFTGFGLLGWYFAKDGIRNKSEYRLSADKIIVSPPPNWVPGRFVEDVLPSSGLNQTGFLLDKTLPQQLTEAFAAYPWVERVKQVVPRYPSGAEVILFYREPTALVEVPQHGIFLVDRNGVLLPPEYLSESDSDSRSRYLTIQGVRSMPLGSVGTPWGDPMVHTAAQLAAALTDITEPLNLALIIPAGEAALEGVRIVCRLQTAAGTEIYWGTFSPDNPKTEAKKKRLWVLHEQFRSLDNVPASLQPIDLSRE